MFDSTSSRKRPILRSTKVRRRLIFPSDESSGNSTTDSSGASSSRIGADITTGSGGSVEGGDDFFLEAFEGVHLGEQCNGSGGGAREPATKRRCLDVGTDEGNAEREGKREREWRTREGKLLYKILPLSERPQVVRLDELKYVLKTSRDTRLLSRVSELYDSMKLKMATKLVRIHNQIEREVDNINTTISPRKALLQLRKRDAISAILAVWGLSTRPHTDTMKTPPRIIQQRPLQEITVLPDGSLVRSNDSGYHDNSRINQTIKTCVDGCTCAGMPPTEHTTGKLLNVTEGDKILNVTQPEERKHSASSDGSYCDCNFCVQQGSRNEEEGETEMAGTETEDPIARFRDQVAESGAHDVRSDVLPHDATYPSHLSRFRETHTETSLNSDDSNASSMVSFNYQDDIMTSSPVAGETVHSLHVTSGGCQGDTTSSCHDTTADHNDTTGMLDVGSLFLLPSETPQVLGVANTGLTDSLIVMGSNSHVSRLSDSEDDEM